MQNAHTRQLLAVAGLVSASLIADAQEDRTIPDDRIQRAIEGELWEAHAVDANGIDLELTGGIATLSGRVGNILSKERAIRIARMTRGVVAVVDRMTVRDSGRSDMAIESDLERAFTADPATDSWEIRATVENGAAILTGTVQSDAEKRLAERVAKSVSGVRSVDNRLTVDYGEPRSDAEIKSEIEQLFRWDARLDDGLILTNVTDGNVTLSGSIGSDFERNLVISRAHVRGVLNVDASELEVESWLRDDMQRNFAWADFSDAEIRSAIERALVLDPRASSFDLHSEVANGIATLTGVVDNLKAKRAAAQVAANTVGVTQVNNNLKVRPSALRGADELTADIEAALARDALVTSDDISVAVADGLATLHGFVDTAFEQAHVEDVVARVNGVTGVRNYLQLHSEGPEYSYRYDDWDPLRYDYDFKHNAFETKTDTEIASDIESELFWSPYVNVNEITVSVDDGIATLSGTVDNWYEWSQADEKAREAGARGVRNNLIVAQD